MISKKDIIEIAHPDVKGTKVIELSTLSELRQQLKDHIKISFMRAGMTDQRAKKLLAEHKEYALECVDDVLCVEGEK